MSDIRQLVTTWRGIVAEAREMKAMALPEDAKFLESRARIMESCADELARVADASSSVTWYQCASCGAEHDVPVCPFPEPEPLMATLLVDSLRQQLAEAQRERDKFKEFYFEIGRARDAQDAMRCAALQRAEAAEQHVAALTRERDELLLDRHQPGRVSACGHYRVFAMPAVHEDGTESLYCMQCDRDRLLDLVATLTTERDGLLIARENDKELLHDHIRAKLSLEATVATLTEALEAILVRIKEGDVRTNWLPTIANIAARALAAARGEPR